MLPICKKCHIVSFVIGFFVIYLHRVIIICYYEKINYAVCFCVFRHFS